MPGALGTIRAVLRLPSLRRLIPAFLAFSVAEWASWIGIVVFAYSRGGPAEAGIVAGVVFIPSIIVAPAASMFGDRRPRAQVLAAAYAILALSMAATAVALVVAPPFVAYLMATVAATSITLVRPAHGALLPEVAPKPDELAVANAASGTVEGLGALLGPLLAGLLIALAGPAAVYGANALLALGAVAAVLPLARGALPLRGAPAARVQGLLAELGAGLRTVLGDRRLLAVMAVLSGAIALLGAFNVLLTIIAIDLLGGQESTIGYVAAVAGVGAVVGAGLTSALMGRERLATIYVGAGALFAGSVAVIGFDPGSVVVLACVVGAGMGWAFVYVEALTLAQRLAGDDVMSRVFGVMESTMMASQAAGALVVPLLIAATRADRGDHRLRVGVRTRGRRRGTDPDPRGPTGPEPRPPIAGAAAGADVRSALGAGPRTARDELDDDAGRGRRHDRGGRRGRRPVLRDPFRRGGGRAADRQEADDGGRGIVRRDRARPGHPTDGHRHGDHADRAARSRAWRVPRGADGTAPKSGTCRCRLTTQVGGRCGRRGRPGTLSRAAALRAIDGIHGCHHEACTADLLGLVVGRSSRLQRLGHATGCGGRVREMTADLHPLSAQVVKRRLLAGLDGDRKERP